MNEEELARQAQKILEEYPTGLRLSLLGAVGEALKDQAREMGVPLEEVVTDEAIQEGVLMVVKRMLGGLLGHFGEFVTEESRGRILEEEFERLAQGRPAGGFPKASCKRP